MLYMKFLLTGFLLLSSHHSGFEKAPETLVKASIVYNLNSYIYWPEPQNREKLTIAVLGGSKVYSILKQFKDIGGRKSKSLEVIHIDQLESLGEAHILYVSTGYVTGVMKKLKDLPVMVIGEGLDCWQENLHVCLIKEGSQYRLQIDPMSFGLSGLDLNPELIDLIRG